MNKFKLLVAPLLVLPFVVGCNNGGGQDVVVYHTLKFVSETCYMKDDIGGQVEEKQFEAGEIANFHLDPYEGYLLPLENQVDFKDTKTDEDFTGIYSYNPSNGDISVKMTADVTIYAGNSEDPNYVNAQEFEDAIAFKDVQYLQVMESKHDEEYTGEYYYKKEMSPTVYYYLGSENPIDTSNAENYREEYCRKNDNPITYDWCYRIDSTGPFNFYTGVESSYFKTPQTFTLGIIDVTLAGLIKTELGLTYDSFDYIKSEHLFKAEFSDYEELSGYVTLKFEDGKVVNFEILFEGFVSSVGSFTYLEKTPEYPNNPTVTQDEFNKACGFEGVQLLQVLQRNIVDMGELGIRTTDNIVEISDLVYHTTYIVDYDESEIYDYFVEEYAKINQLSDTTCIYTYRYDTESSWATPETDDTINRCMRPEYFNPLLVKEMTGYECNPSLAYENFNLVGGQYIYTGKATKSSEEYDAKMELTFADKKLTHCLFTLDDGSQFNYECTFEYENITPVWPL